MAPGARRLPFGRHRASIPRGMWTDVGGPTFWAWTGRERRARPSRCSGRSSSSRSRCRAGAPPTRAALVRLVLFLFGAVQVQVWSADDPQPVLHAALAAAYTLPLLAARRR